MKEKINISEVIKVGVILFLITAILSALLAFVNAKTAPIIAENTILKEQEAMKTVMRDAAEFEEVTVSYTSPNGQINKAYAALDSNKNIIGACIITETTGYDVGIQTVTGVNRDLAVTGVDIISMNETPGLGANADTPEFLEMYVEKTGEIGVSKTTADDKNIQAISGATRTSKGVTNGVNIALEAAKEIIGGDK